MNGTLRALCSAFRLPWFGMTVRTMNANGSKNGMDQTHRGTNMKKQNGSIVRSIVGAAGIAAAGSDGADKTTTECATLRCRLFLRLTLFEVLRIQLSVDYYYNASVLEVRMDIKFYGLIAGWVNLYTAMIYRRDFSGDGGLPPATDDIMGEEDGYSSGAGCDWDKHHGAVALSYADNHKHNEVYWSSSSAKAACLNMGTTKCRAVTCCWSIKCGAWRGCTLRMGEIRDSHMNYWEKTNRYAFVYDANGWWGGSVSRVERTGFVPLEPSGLGEIEHTWVPKPTCPYR